MPLSESFYDTDQCTPKTQIPASPTASPSDPLPLSATLSEDYPNQITYYNPLSPRGRAQTPLFICMGRETKERAQQAILAGAKANSQERLALSGEVSRSELLSEVAAKKRNTDQVLQLYPSGPTLDTSDEGSQVDEASKSPFSYKC